MRLRYGGMRVPCYVSCGGSGGGDVEGLRTGSGEHLRVRNYWNSGPIAVMVMGCSPDSATRSRLLDKGALGRLGDLGIAGVPGLSLFGVGRGLDFREEPAVSVFHGRCLAMMVDGVSVVKRCERAVVRFWSLS